jgi:general secretion pathway protein F
VTLYRYKAVGPSGDVVTGELDVATRPDAVERVRDMGLMPVRVDEAGRIPADARAAAPARRREWFVARRVSADQMIGFTRELATLLRSGVPLDRALEILIGLAAIPAVQTMLQRIRDDVRGGVALSQALDKHRAVFDRFYVNIVRAGEAGGALALVLTRLADSMERAKELRESVRSALIYPSLLVVVAAISVAILLVWVIPQFEQTFQQAGKALPFATQFVLTVGQFLRSWWWLVLVGLALAVQIFRRQLRHPASRRRWDRRALTWPLLGPVVARIEIARFSRTLATLLGNGVTLLSALSIAKDTMGNAVLAEALDGVILRLREGKGFGKPLAETGLFPRLATQMIMVGEESGKLEEMLARVADTYDREVQIAVRRFLAVLEPVLILGLAVMIGGIVFSILLGVMGMAELVQ